MEIGKFGSHPEVGCRHDRKDHVVQRLHTKDVPPRHKVPSRLEPRQNRTLSSRQFVRYSPLTPNYLDLKNPRGGL